MPQIYGGRYTAEHNEPFVVFLIGMRVNKLLAVRRWIQTASAMGPMLATLAKHPEKGLLGGETWVRWREIMIVQYWRSYENLERFARDRDDPHLEAWRQFNRAVGSDGSVGIWHETFVVAPGQFETVYGNMPRVGLSAATTHVPVGAGRGTARERLRGEVYNAAECQQGV
jgi:hypothetical protein